jgi:hypothetical protein
MAATSVAPYASLDWESNRRFLVGLRGHDLLGMGINPFLMPNFVQVYEERGWKVL